MKDVKFVSFQDKLPSCFGLPLVRTFSTMLHKVLLDADSDYYSPMKPFFPAFEKQSVYNSVYKWLKLSYVITGHWPDQNKNLGFMLRSSQLALFQYLMYKLVS